MNLELAATNWLANYKRCMIVLRELSPRSGSCGEPDAYGVTMARFGIEVEVKRSLSDFHADKQKHSRRQRDLWPDRFPKQFYYLLPEAIAEKAKASLPEWSGLLSVGNYGVVRILVDAPFNRQSKKLTIKECVQLAHQMSVYAARVDERLDASVTAWKNGYEPYFWSYSI